MLLCSAGLRNAPEEGTEILAMETISGMTQGLPIAINSIGSWARYFLEECGVSAVKIWSIVCIHY